MFFNEQTSFIITEKCKNAFTWEDPGKEVMPNRFDTDCSIVCYQIHLLSFIKTD